MTTTATPPWEAMRTAETRMVEDRLRPHLQLVGHPRLRRVRTEEIEEIAGIDEDDRNGSLALDQGEGVGEGDRHAADTSSVYRESNRHWSKKRWLSSWASSFRQVW